MARFLKDTPFKINISDNYENLCEKVTREILSSANEKIAKRNKFTLVLSGGSTPKGIYQRMASPFYRDKFQWEKIHFFLGDERWVSPDDSRSNYRMVSESLFTKVKIPPGNIHVIQTRNCDLQASALLFEHDIVDFFELRKDEFPHFDLVLLGLGQDGHIASLFPKNLALSVKDRLAIAVSQDGITEQRITLTFPVINHANTVFLLASGYEKAKIVHEVMEEKRNSLPANQIKLGQGKLYWFLDKASASGLEKATTSLFVGASPDDS